MAEEKQTSEDERAARSIYYSAAMNHGTAGGGGSQLKMLHSVPREIQPLGRVHVSEVVSARVTAVCPNALERSTAKEKHMMALIDSS